MLVNGLDNRLTEEQAVVVEGRERQAGREQTGEVCDVQVDDMGERQTGGTEGVMEQDLLYCQRNAEAANRAMTLGQRSAGGQVGVLNRQTVVRVRAACLTTVTCPRQSARRQKDTQQK